MALPVDDLAKKKAAAAKSKPKPAPAYNPWNGLGHEGSGLTGGASETGAAVAPPPPPPPPGAPAAPPPPPPIDWNAVLALDPGLTAVKAQTDANIAAYNEQFNGASNPFSTVKQLALSLGQNIRSNANAHASHGTLFGGGTAQGAQNANRDNQKARYDATNALNQNIGAQNSLYATELGNATSRILANPERYGISATAPGDPGNNPPPADVPPPPPPPPPPAAVPFVTPAQLKANPHAAQVKKNNRY